VRLYHFTSERGARGIIEDGEIRTELHSVLGEHLVWLTDDPTPKASHLGMQRRRIGRITTEDRMARRFDIDTDAAMAWTEARTRYGDALVAILESSPGARPERWFVAFGALPLHPGGETNGN
jgi:hypothetical protein